jgi:hypothetical protein
MSFLNEVVGHGVKSLVHRAEAAAPEALHAAARDVAEGLADRLTLAARRPPELLFPRTAVGLAVAGQAAQVRLAPVIKQAGRTTLFAPDRYGVLDLRAYQRNAHTFVGIAKDFREEFRGHTYLRDRTREVFGADDPVAEQAQSLRTSLYWRMQDAARRLEQMPMVTPGWVRKAWQLIGFDADAFDRKVLTRLGPKGLAEVPGWVPRAWEKGPAGTSGP